MPQIGHEPVFRIFWRHRASGRDRVRTAQIIEFSDATHLWLRATSATA